jgi:IclR family acetate operon transcriptional repressor
MANDYVVRPVVKALQVLKCLGEEGHALSLTEIANRVGLPKTSVFRYLYTLRESGFVVHDPSTDLYRVSLRVWEFGQLTRDQLMLCEIALPAMQTLRDRFDATVNLGVLEERDVVYIEMVESRRSIRTLAGLGGRDTAYSTALGKAILAFLPDDRRSSHLPAWLTPRTPRTLVTFAKLEKDLDATRARGFALDDGENEEAARCLGAPIFDRHGPVVAAISLAAPADRLRGRTQARAAAAVVQAAADVSFRLDLRPGERGPNAKDDRQRGTP